ncbi:MAG: hypothetical protein LBU27_07345 [Candidatus Peribacteria bacterium]|jgi:vacuolar-type H+-ATPase subunit H|nr:hypothetical protein [Candidatus Peribacteria bacterium]
MNLKKVLKEIGIPEEQISKIETVVNGGIEIVNGATAKVRDDVKVLMKSVKAAEEKKEQQIKNAKTAAEQEAQQTEKEAVKKFFQGYTDSVVAGTKEVASEARKIVNQGKDCVESVLETVKSEVKKINENPEVVAATEKGKNVWNSGKEFCEKGV